MAPPIEGDGRRSLVGAETLSWSSRELASAGALRSWAPRSSRARAHADQELLGARIWRPSLRESSGELASVGVHRSRAPRSSNSRSLGDHRLRGARIRGASATAGSQELEFAGRCRSRALRSWNLLGGSVRASDARAELTGAIGRTGRGPGWSGRSAYADGAIEARDASRVRNGS